MNKLNSWYKCFGIVGLLFLSFGSVKVSHATVKQSLQLNSDRYLLAENCSSDERKVATRKGSPLKVHADHQVKSNTIGRIPNGTVVLWQDSDSSGKWAKVTDKEQNLSGWVWAGYLKCTN